MSKVKYMQKRLIYRGAILHNIFESPYKANSMTMFILKELLLFSFVQKTAGSNITVKYVNLYRNIFHPYPSLNY